jgi:hypothetical protein
MSATLRALGSEYRGGGLILKKDESKLPAELKRHQNPEEQPLALPVQTESQREAREASRVAAAARGALFIEKRREARYPTRDAAEVEVVRGGNSPISATVLDVSRSGLRLGLQTAVDKGAEVKITLQKHIVIFGQVRHCRRAGEAFEAGILIQDLSKAAGPANVHIEDDLLALYVIGKGLTVPEVIKLKEHLVNCEACRIRLGETDAILNPVRKRKILGAPEDLSEDSRD